MLIKITYGNKATINTGNYENENPMYSISIEQETNKPVERETIEAELNDLKKIISSIDGM